MNGFAWDRHTAYICTNEEIVRLFHDLWEDFSKRKNYCSCSVLWGLLLKPVFLLFQGEGYMWHRFQSIFIGCLLINWLFDCLYTCIIVKYLWRSLFSFLLFFLCPFLALSYFRISCILLTSEFSGWSWSGQLGLLVAGYCGYQLITEIR